MKALAPWSCCLAASLALMPAIAWADTSSGSTDESCQNQERDSRMMAARQAMAQKQGNALSIGSARTLSFTQAIGRIEVSRENVIRVSAPTSRSLRITGVNEGEAQLTIFATDGTVLSEDVVRVGADGVGSTDAAFYGAGYADRRIVAVDIQFAAISSSTLKQLGFNFSKLSGDIQGAVVSPSSLSASSTPFSEAFNLFLSSNKQGLSGVMSALSSNGLSQLLAQPTLLTRSGEKACFLAGGEFPVPVPQSSGGSSNTLSIEYKEFGVRLSVTPWVMSKEHIVLSLRPEVSELDYINGIQLAGYTVPGIRKRYAETTVELGSGQSFVIAGLTYSNSAVTKAKVPLLGDLPILGAFFKRQENSKERQELIIIATPRLVEPTAQLPSLEEAKNPIDPTIGQMILGNDGVEQAVGDFGVVRR